MSAIRGFHSTLSTCESPLLTYSNDNDNKKLTQFSQSERMLYK